MGNRLIWRLITSMVLLILVSVLILNFFVSIKLRDNLESSVEERLRSNTLLAARLLLTDMESPGIMRQRANELSGLLAARVTVMDNEGTVLADSEKSAGSMGPHGDRPEILKALSIGIGQSTRHSISLGYRMIYVAVPIGKRSSPAGFVRLSLPLSEVESWLKGIYMIVLTGGFLAVCFVIIIGFYVSKGIIGPLSEMTDVARAITAGDFSKRLRLKGTDELVILASSLNRMSDELAGKMKSLEEAGRMKTELVANVSHELKTPLTSIMGYVETLEDGALEDRENAGKFLAIIRRQAQGLSNTINDLLELSELEGARAGSLETEEIDLREILEDVIAGFGNVLKEKDQRIRTEHKGTDLRLLADRLKIEHALINIVDNAVKYTPEGGEIRVVLREKPESMDITVSDTGIGIPVEHLSRVFERFYRVDKARSKRVGGTGLGLAIVKHTVALHGGSVKIDSEPGKGTVVTISLPKSS